MPAPDRTTRRSFFAGSVAAVIAARTMRGQEARVPAFHAHAPKEPLPETKSPALFLDRPLVKKVYELAGQIRPVLYQQPCYCNCDKFAGHGSLLDCFVDAHGEECGICQREAVYAFVKTKAGRTPAEIRAEIMAGEWKRINLSLPALEKL